MITVKDKLICQACHPKAWQPSDGGEPILATHVYTGQTHRGPAAFCDRHTAGSQILDNRLHVWHTVREFTRLGWVAP